MVQPTVGEHDPQRFDARSRPKCECVSMRFLASATSFARAQPTPLALSLSLVIIVEKPQSPFREKFSKLDYACCKNPNDLKTHYSILFDCCLWSKWLFREWLFNESQTILFLQYFRFVHPQMHKTIEWSRWKASRLELFWMRARRRLCHFNEFRKYTKK